MAGMSFDAEPPQLISLSALAIFKRLIKQYTQESRVHITDLLKWNLQQ